MHITVFGATGATGQLLVREALNEGATVVVYARHPDKLRITNGKLSVVQGELSDAAAIERAVQGSDGVISLLGQGVPAKGNPIAAGTRNILAAMQKAGVRRIVAVATASAADPADRPPLRSKAAIGFAKLFMRAAYEDVVATAQAIRASDRDWTIVRPPLLRDGPRTGQVVVGYLGDGVTGNYLSRSNAADFMFNQLHDSTYFRQAPIVADANERRGPRGVASRPCQLVAAASTRRHRRGRRFGTEHREGFSAPGHGTCKGSEP